MNFRRLLLSSLIISLIMLGLRVTQISKDVEALGVATAQAEDMIKDKDIEAAKEKLAADTLEQMKKDEADKAKDVAVKADVKEEHPETAKEDAGKKDAHETPAKEEKAPTVKENNPDNPMFYSDAEIEVLQQLSARRSELDERERSLLQKESLLKVTEERLDQKITELNQIKENLATIQASVMQSITEVDKKEDEEMKKLVKTYETMKPKDAARIFDETDINIVFKIISRMKESKLAPVLANMDAQKAKELTGMLAARKKTPNPETDAVSGMKNGNNPVASTAAGQETPDTPVAMPESSPSNIDPKIY